MNHAVERSGDIWTCSLCSFRAVHTSRGAYTLNNGDGRDMHLAAIVEALSDQRRHVAHVLARLRTQPLDREQLRRLGHCVVTEYDV